MFQAIPFLPDPFQVTCPYCSYTAFYGKGSLHSNGAAFLSPAKIGVIAAMIAITGLVLLLLPALQR